MKSIGFPPGSNNFRLLMIVILVAALWVLFFNYTDKISRETEKAAIQQMKNNINSTLVIVFATYAVKDELDRLNELNGSNPFIIMSEYNRMPETYKGRLLVNQNLEDLAPGWYYDKLNRRTIYKAYYDEGSYFFSIVLNYRDANGSGQFESGVDEYRHLIFKQLLQQ